jgi:excalibur calcium-binding domain-containing protein
VKFVLRITFAVSAILLAAPASSGVAGFDSVASPGAGTAVPGQYRNCTALNRRYPHGVGRVGARDKTSGVPVTTFKRSNRLYELNKARDRDKDRIACEKR